MKNQNSQTPAGIRARRIVDVYQLPGEDFEATMTRADAEGMGAGVIMVHPCSGT